MHSFPDINLVIAHQLEAEKLIHYLFPGLFEVERQWFENRSIKLLKRKGSGYFFEYPEEMVSTRTILRVEFSEAGQAFGGDPGRALLALGVRPGASSQHAVARALHPLLP